MFFDNDLFYRFVDRAHSAGISLPIVPGVMPITRASQVERAINLSGSYMPPEFMEIYNRFGSSDDDMMKAGIDYATRQIADLLMQGVGNVHVYTMNKPCVASAIKNNLLDLLTDE
jgi:methylenetetrahydrofolate reductase (NADPH)